MRRLLAVLPLAVLLAGCASTRSATTGAAGPLPARQATPNVNLSGYNAAFKAGYMDGCESARQTQRRDAARYGTDTDYTMGWNDGRAICARR